MKSTFTDQEKKHIIDNRLFLSSGQLAQKLNCSKTKIQRFLTENGLQPPVEVIKEFRRKAMTGRTILSERQDFILKRDYLAVPIKKLAMSFGVSQTAIRKRLSVLNLVIPKELAEQRKRANQIKVGNIPKNKGKKMPAHVYRRCKGTMFKKGHLPHNAVGYKNGDLSFREDKTGRVYIYIRLSKGKWYPLHQYCWEVTNGKVPKGHCLLFKNADTMDCTLGNLMLITKAELMDQNSCSKRLTDNFIALTLSRRKGGIGLFDSTIKSLVLQDKSLIELKRKQLQLNRSINERKKSK